MLKTLTRMLVPEYKRSRPIEKRVCILIPMTSEPSISEEEMVAVRQLEHFLPGYDCFFLTPKGRPFHREGYGCEEFDHKYFGSVGAHARLLLNPDFYKRFEHYEYIFWYHLDAIVLSSDLERWLDADWDFIGPPWIVSPETPWVDKPRVGNNGFGLLRIEPITRALINRYREDPSFFWTDKIIRHGRKLGWFFNLLKRLAKWRPHPMFVLPVRRWEASERQHANGDVFFADKAVNYNPDFKVAPFEEGLKFGFETDPKQCLEMNNGELPFGAHAWYKIDKAFWEPHLLPQQEAKNGD